MSTYGVMCAAKNCKNYFSSGRSLFRFPKDSSRARKWLIRCRRPDLVEIFMKDANYLYRNCRLCSDHFENSQFCNLQLKNRLIRHAMPTLFGSSSSEEGTADDYAVEEDEVCLNASTCNPNNVALRHNHEIPVVVVVESFDHGLDVEVSSSTSLPKAPAEMTPEEKMLGQIGQEQTIDMMHEETTIANSGQDSFQDQSAVLQRRPDTARRTYAKKPRTEVPGSPSQTEVRLGNQQAKDPGNASDQLASQGNRPSTISRAKMQKHGTVDKRAIKLAMQRKRTALCRQRKREKQVRLAATRPKNFESRMKSCHEHLGSPCDEGKKATCGSRYSEYDKRFALSLYYSSSKAYIFCSKTFCLPTIRTLRKMSASAKNEARDKSLIVTAVSNFLKSYVEQ